ncbi:RimJ/RimL family protein N-acetyltransferase [Microvirga lupini]|uniref:RimJ/RimL family protein N-acetyltransferase n=2 Tax=Microvirga lupini TaxID=420324 RepID=A0A7W4VPE0_9HYPH|nr:RimJ/RimL family protein N-acetyltransferase [Microvirga lupini]
MDRSKTMFPDLTRDDVFRLETRSLWLRWARLADTQAIVRLAGEKAVAEMTARIPHPYHPDDAERFIFMSRRSNADGQGLQLAITPKGKPNSLIGMVGIGPSAETGKPDLGYWLGTPYWGKGYVTEAVRALIDAFFAYGEEDEITACARVINPGSRRVLEKCGFAYQGAGLSELPARCGLYPVDHFRLDRRTWESLKAWGQTGFVREPLSLEVEVEREMSLAS